MEMVTGLLTRVFNPSASRNAAARDAGNRRASVDAAVAWWLRSLAGRDGVAEDALEPFARALRADLMARLDTTYRVYLEVVHQPKGVLRDAALATGLDLDAFPAATTMAVTDVKVEVSKAAAEPYQVLHAA
ncbi:MAG TPA: hypothetical protein VGM69_18385 [Chloroflexota bacterium]|jgi:hypothetical protein